MESERASTGMGGDGKRVPGVGRDWDVMEWPIWSQCPNINFTIHVSIRFFFNFH